MIHSNSSLTAFISSAMLSLVVLLCALAPASTMSECIDFELDKIDAITTLQNGSTLLVSGPRYWILQTDETPSIHSSKPLSHLLGRTFLNLRNESTYDNQILAAVNVRISANQGECALTNQIVLYSLSDNSSTFTFTMFENDQRRVMHNHTDIDYLAAAKSVNWSLPVDAITFWQNTVIVFQNHQFVSVICRNGIWREEFVKKIPQVFPGLPHDQMPDSVTIRGRVGAFEARPLSYDSPLIPIDSATVYLFYGSYFYECDVTGTDVCEGPYGLMSEFFNIHSYCGTSRAMGKIVLVVVLVLILGSVATAVFLFVCHFFGQSRQDMRYFVNGKQYDREQTSYETLKMFNDNHNLTPLDENIPQTASRPEHKTLNQ